MDGMDICSNELCFCVFIQLERTHEPCAPTCISELLCSLK